MTVCLEYRLLEQHSLESEPAEEADNDLYLSQLLAHARLSPNEMQVILRRFGIDGPIAHERLGPKLGLSRARSQQLEASALEKLRRTAKRLAWGVIAEGFAG